MKKGVLLLSILIGVLIFSSCQKDEDDPTPAPTETTSLELNLRDNYGNPISDASVKLYSSLTDWSNGTDQVGTTQISNADGQVNFTDLSNIKYYWFAEKDCKNNFNENVTSTSPLTANVENTFNVSLSSTGTLIFISTSTNPYQIYINGTEAFDMDGGTTKYKYYMPTGDYTIRVLQLDGYVLYPTDETFTGTLGCGQTLTTTFP